MLLDKLKAVRPLSSDVEQDVILPISRKDYAYLTMVATRYHVTVTQLLYIIFDTGIYTLAEESGLVRK